MTQYFTIRIAEQLGQLIRCRKREGFDHSAPRSKHAAVKFSPGLMNSIDAVNQKEKKFGQLQKSFLKFTRYRSRANILTHEVKILTKQSLSADKIVF
jgi:hypothetical protein